MWKFGKRKTYGEVSLVCLLPGHDFSVGCFVDCWLENFLVLWCWNLVFLGEILYFDGLLSGGWYYTTFFAGLVLEVESSYGRIYLFFGFAGGILRCCSNLNYVAVLELFGIRFLGRQIFEPRTMMNPASPFGWSTGNQGA